MHKVTGDSGQIDMVIAGIQSSESIFHRLQQILQIIPSGSLW